MANHVEEFIGPQPLPSWQAIQPAHDKEILDWAIEEIGIDFKATPAVNEPGKWDVIGKDSEGNQLGWSNCELLRDPVNPRRLDIVRQFISRHRKELIVGIASGMVIAAAGKGVVEFQRHRATK